MVVSGDHTKASVDLLKDAPKLELGLHLVFTDVGSSSLTASAASSLVDSQRRFLKIHQLLFRCVSGRIDSSAVFDEICAQAELFGKLIGRAPTHVDGHHHAHQFPVIRQAMLRAMKEGILPRLTRRTVEAPGMLSAIRSCRARRFVLNMLGQAASADFRRVGICTNDYFFGVLNERNLLQENPWEEYLAALPARGSVEWMVHPGFYDESLLGRDNYIDGRVRELAALTRPPISAAVRTAAVGYGEDGDARVATMPMTGSAHGDIADHCLSSVRGEESDRFAKNRPRGSADMRALQTAAADASRPGRGD
jgi:hypothetical protein